MGLSARIGVLLTIAFVLSACAGGVPEQVSGAFPQAYSVTRLKVDAPGIVQAWQVRDAQGCLEGLCFFTEEAGFNGPVNLFVLWTPAAGITGIEVYSHSETWDYAGKYLNEPWFIGQFLNKPDVTAFNLVKLQKQKASDVVIITGATISSRAVLQAVNICLEVCLAMGGAEE